MTYLYFSGPRVVRLNVGGVMYTTSQTTLCKYPESKLGAMFSGNVAKTVAEDGSVFIDGNGKYFEFILDFLRTGELILPQMFNDIALLEREARYYQIEPLIALLNERKRTVRLMREMRDIRAIMDESDEDMSEAQRRIAISRNIK